MAVASVWSRIAAVAEQRDAAGVPGPPAADLVRDRAVARVAAQSRAAGQSPGTGLTVIVLAASPSR